MENIKTIGIIGVGLLGGSIGLAIKKKYSHVHVIGMGRNKEKLQKGVDYKALDKYDLDLVKGVKECDLIIIATPIWNIVETYKKILPGLTSNAIVTDVGSTKKEIVEQIELLSDTKIFIGSHPMAGSEKSGVDAACDDLYINKTVVVTETDRSDISKLEIVERFWNDLGANVVRMSSVEHDRMVAYTSHLPHLLASSLTYSISENISESDMKYQIYGNGLMDTTRIAEGSPEIWIDILTSNKENILKSISSFKQDLEIIENQIKEDKTQEIINYLEKAKRFREFINTLNNKYNLEND